LISPLLVFLVVANILGLLHSHFFFLVVLPFCDTIIACLLLHRLFQ
jgi:hypothetical protein